MAFAAGAETVLTMLRKARRQHVSRGDTGIGGAAGRSRRGQKLRLVGMGSLFG
jgi:hypothetical protein